MSQGVALGWILAAFQAKPLHADDDLPGVICPYGQIARKSPAHTRLKGGKIKAQGIALGPAPPKSYPAVKGRKKTTRVDDVGFTQRI